ncbi:MAG: hypothetical protein HOC24_05195 [Deltaproteobacteria bacterium]|nr:hypothetical protein [Deltaproteobacteria bacterium]
MIFQFKRWFTPPVFADDELKTKQINLLNASLIVVIIFVLLVFVGNLVGGEIPNSTLIINGVILITALLMRFWMYHGNITLVAVGLVSIAILLITVSIISLGTIRTPTTAVYLLIIIWAGLLLNLRGLLVTTIFCSLSVYGIIFAENHGMLPLPILTVNITQWVTYTALFGLCGGLSYFAHQTTHQTLIRLNKEITEHKQTEKSLKESEINLRRAHRIAKMGTWVYDNINKTANWSDEYFRLLGINKTKYPDRKVPDSGWLSILESPKETQALVNSLMDKNDYYESEYRTVPINGKVKAIYSYCEVERDNNGDITRIFGTDHDITMHKQAEEALKNSHDELEKKIEERTIEYKKAKEDAEQANHLKSEFLANMSHELHTPMHHILSFAQIGIRRFNTAKDKTLDSFEKIISASNRMMVLINNLLDLSELESGRVDYQMEKTELADIIKNLINEFSSIIDGKSIYLELKKPKYSTIVMCDDIKISQVLRNLISNALKFTSPNQSIIISFKQQKLPEGKGQTDNDMIPALTLRIKDKGIGIPENELESVFDKFVQSSKTNTGAGGTGLGLAICKKIIPAHKGKIWAENNTEGGATFSFLLPYEQKEPVIEKR